MKRTYFLGITDIVVVTDPIDPGSRRSTFWPRV